MRGSRRTWRTSKLHSGRDSVASSRSWTSLTTSSRRQTRRLARRYPMSNHPTYVIPTKDLVDRALARLGKLLHRRAFYSKLDNPNWVKALDEAHTCNNTQ